MIDLSAREEFPYLLSICKTFLIQLIEQLGISRKGIDAAGIIQRDDQGFPMHSIVFCKCDTQIVVIRTKPQFFCCDGVFSLNPLCQLQIVIWQTDFVGRLG